MTATGIPREMMPMDGAMKNMFMTCCEAMMDMIQMGMPMMINRADMKMLCTPAKAAS